MNWETIAGVQLVVLIAYFMFGVSGFGSSLIAVPLLSHLMPLRSAVMLALVLDLISAMGQSRKDRVHIRWDELKSMIPFAFIGIIAGAVLLSRVANDSLLFVLGVFVIAMGTHYLLSSSDGRTVSSGWSAPAGLVGGIASSLFGTGGPAYMGFLGHRLESRHELRATFSGLLALDGSLRVAVFIAGGIFFSSLNLSLLIAVLPIMLLGLWLGRCAHTVISNRQMKYMIAILLIMSGMSLVLRGI
ncbi:MAG: sulfite exporter TauE/SafE family protein [Thiobacillus sp.]